MVGWILVSILFVFVCGTVMLARYTRRMSFPKPPTELNLDSVRDAMIEKYGWSVQRADAAKEEYLRFLTLVQKKPGFMIVPWLDSDGRDDLDQFWHQHILDTAKYASDCQAVFGRMIHHNPHVPRGSQLEEEAVTKTNRFYARTFQSGPFGAPASEDAFIGCSTCSADSLDSHAHGSHSDHGGSTGDSGHSCGGHSCGGHGCGHGCGGH